MKELDDWFKTDVDIVEVEELVTDLKLILPELSDVELRCLIANGGDGDELDEFDDAKEHLKEYLDSTILLVSKVDIS